MPPKSSGQVLTAGAAAPPQVSEKDTTCLLEASTSAQCRGWSSGAHSEEGLDVFLPLLSQKHPPP